MEKRIKTKIVQLSKKIGEPFYLYDKQGIINKCKQFMNIPYKNKIVAFATMANANRDFLNTIKSQGLSVFVNSIPHLELCLTMGFNPQKIVFTSSAMDKKTMTVVAKSDCMINLDSISQIDKWRSLFPNKPFGIRCNIGTLIKAKETRAGYFLGKKSRLGLSIKDISSLNKKDIVGLHLYAGTDIIDIDYFKKCYIQMIKLAKHFPYLTHLDLGGGFGVATKKGETFDISKYGIMITQLMGEASKKLDKPITLILEAGRIIGSESAWFVTKVTDIKRRWGHQFVGLNASTVQFPRPLLYPDNAYHPLIFFSKHNGYRINSSIYGCSTYSRDYFLQNKQLPLIKEGELIIFGNAGSYCSAMFTNFLGFEKPKEVFI